MTVRSRLIGPLAAVLLLPGIGSAHLGSHEVRVRNSYFEPRVLEVSPGETVTWLVEGSDHTITEADGAFRFPSSGTVEEGEIYQWTTPNTDAWVLYECEIHSGMTGAIKVGDPPPPPPVEPPEEVRTVPSTEHPTIEAALTDLAPRVRIELAPGTYALDAGLIIKHPPSDPTTAGVSTRTTIVGTGSSPSDVVISGSGDVGTGIGTSSDGLRLANLTLADFTYAAVFLQDVARYSITDVVIEEPGRFGISVVGGEAGLIAATTVTGATAAGVALSECPACDVLLTTIAVSNSRAGVTVVDAGPIVLINSTLRDNGDGIILRSTLGADDAPQRGSHIFGNVIADNTASGFDATAEPLGKPLGVGVWIDGGWHNVVEGNVITGHAWNLLITGFGGPTFGTRVLHNTFTDAAVDVAWDGLGADSCLEGNDDVITEPPTLATVYACDSAPPVGTPYPAITAAVLAASR